MTSNGERAFPPPFLRRCLQLEMQLPDRDKLARIVSNHLKLGQQYQPKINDLIDNFLKRRDDQKADLATDQLLNAIYLAMHNIDPEKRYKDKEALIDTLWRSLTL